MKQPFTVPGSVECATAQDTREFGRRLGAALEAGDVVILSGPLGAGKTTLTQGIADGLQVKGRVTSPTFIIAREHASTVDGPSLVHVDAYRLLDSVGGTGAVDPLGELDALDLDTDLEDSVVVAEWGSGLVEQLASRYLMVTLDRETLANGNDNGTDEEQARIIEWRLAG